MKHAMRQGQLEKIRLAHKLWWLLWLCPYLFFSVAAEGLHHHALCAAAASPVQVRATPSSPGTKAHSVIASKAIHAPESECMACQWTAVASPLLAAPLDFTPPVKLGHPAIHAVVAIPFDDVVYRATRGPPTPC